MAEKVCAILDNNAETVARIMHTTLTKAGSRFRVPTGSPPMRGRR